MYHLPATVKFSCSLTFKTSLRGISILLFLWGLLNAISYGLSNNQNSLSYALVIFILGAISLVAAGTGSINRFLFSCAFWVAVEFIFYIALKSLYLIGEEDFMALNQALLVSLLFIIGYWIGQSLKSTPTTDLHRAPFLIEREDKNRLYKWLLTSFIGFKLLGTFLFLALGQGQNVLEIAQSTQNQGAAYIFRIPKLSEAAYFIFLLFSYKHKIFQKTAIVLTLFVMTEAIVSAGRYTLITMTFINLFLYHTYIKPIRIGILLIVSPALIFTVAFFGYVRNIELANFQVYSEALHLFIDESDLILKLFLSRLDMLPHMIEAFQLDATGNIKYLSGMSYLYAFLHAIPRNIWPEKPPLTAAYVTGQTNPSTFEDGVNIFPSIMLEGYMNFSWLGPIIIGIIIARMASIYEQALYRGSILRQTFALMIFTFPMGLINEGIHSNIFATIIYLLAIYFFWTVGLKAILGKRTSKALS